jgi:hypothetical protein
MNNARISLCFILAGYVFSAYPGIIYYVDYSAGSDVNNGTSTSTPWKHCPGDANATGNANSILNQGTTIIFKGGVTYGGGGSGNVAFFGANYTAQIVVSASGTSGNPIIYDGNSAGTFGTGKAIMSSNSVSNVMGFQIIASGSSSISYVTIQNFEICHYGDYTSAQLSAYNCTTNLLPTTWGVGIYMNGVSNVTIQNCYFHEIGIWQNWSPVFGDSDILGFGIVLNSGNNVTITGNECTKISYPIYMFVYNANVGNISQVTVSNNYIHSYVRWGVSGGCNQNNATFQDVNIFGNQICNYPEYDNSPDITDPFCSGAPHADGIILFNGYSINDGVQQDVQNLTLGVPGHPVKIYNNTFYQNSTTAGGTAFIFLTDWGGTNYVYNNTFVNCHPVTGGECSIAMMDGLLASDNNPAVDYHIWNNTFFDHLGSICVRNQTSGFDFNRAGYTIDIRNNIFYDNDTTDGPENIWIQSDYDHSLSTNLPTTVDYNIYYTNPNNPNIGSAASTIFGVTGVGINNPVYTYYTLAQSRSTFGFDAHSQYIDPKFVNISYGLGINSSLNNLNLQASSPAINAGVSLDSFFTTDIAGTSRPPANRHSQGSGWDIGAYEYQSSGVIEMPPPAASEFALSAYPNPFRGPVTVAFNVPIIHRGSLNNVEVAIYDLKGVLIAQLAKGAYRAGRYLISWDASAIGLSACFVRMKAKNFEKQLMLIRVGK